MVIILQNSEIFLNSFSEIEDYLEKYTNTVGHDSFANLVNKASRSNSIIREYKTDLYELKDLRNAIVHERSDGHIIAEPHEATVKLIQKIEKLLKNPPKVLPLFRGEVVTLRINNSIQEAVSLMEKKSYTQIPILDNNSNYYDLLTTNTIVRWLGAKSKKNSSSFLDINIKQVLKFKENNNVCLFIPANTDLMKILEIFDKYRDTQKKLESIIITRNGDSTEEFLGIITGWDLPVIYHKIEIF